MFKAFFLTILILQALFLNAQNTLQKMRIFTCDTSISLFLKTNNQKALSLQKNAAFVYHIYEADSYYNPAYSFIQWQSQKVKKNLFTTESRTQSDKKSVSKKINSPLLDNIRIDSLIEIIRKVEGCSSDTSIMLSHNHLFFFSFYYKKKYVSFKICEDQLAVYLHQEEITYLREIIAQLRRELK